MTSSTTVWLEIQTGSVYYYVFSTSEKLPDFREILKQCFKISRKSRRNVSLLLVVENGSWANYSMTLSQELSVSKGLKLLLQNYNLSYLKEKCYINIRAENFPPFRLISAFFKFYGPILWIVQNRWVFFVKKCWGGGKQMLPVIR